jgi:hypothetical protein
MIKLMNRSLFVAFLIFYCSVNCILTSSVAWAATDQPDPNLSNTATEGTETNGEVEKNVDTQTIDITQPKAATAEQKLLIQDEQEAFYPFQSSISPRLGAVLMDSSISSNTKMYLLGFNYMADSPLSEHWEAGADLISNSSGYFHGGKKWVYRHHTSFRPFLKAALAVLVEPGKALGSFVEYKNYQVRLAGGAELLINSPMSLRADLEAGFSLKGTWAAFILGYSYAW